MSGGHPESRGLSRSGETVPQEKAECGDGLGLAFVEAKLKLEACFRKEHLLPKDV